VRLQPNQWASGDRLWIMTAAGDPRALPYFLRQLAEKDFKDQSVKIRVLDSGGKPTIKTLAECLAPAPAIRDTAAAG
jgi:hemolysin-activating ACP:hemolysin acyltransferase